MTLRSSPVSKTLILLLTTSPVWLTACGSAPNAPHVGLLASGSWTAMPAVAQPLQGLLAAPRGIGARKIIGDNNLLPVTGDGSNVPAQFKGLLDAFGRMSMSCTATHVGHGIVITAGHCFRANSVRQEKLSCEGVKVEWGMRADNKPSLISNCEQILVQETSDRADYAIFKVDEAPAVAAVVSTSPVQMGQNVTVFGHPQDRPLEWSGFCEVLSPTNGGFDSADFSHQCDTEVGNSGSTAIDSQTAEVVGIHNGGVSPFNYGTFISNTPLQQYEAFYSGREQVPPLETEKGALAFGKLDLGNDQNDKLLTELSRPGAAVVNFKLTVNLEGSYDSVVLEDAEGKRSSKITGKETFDLSGVKAPVKVLFSSDSSGLSTLVKISQIIYL